MTATGSADRVAEVRAPPPKNRERVWKLVAAASGILLVGFIVFVATRPHHPRSVSYPVTPPVTLAAGSEAPGFALPRLGGGPPVSLTSFRGKPTVVNFFASWCSECKRELSAFAALAHRTAGQVNVVGVDSNDTESAAASVVAQAGVGYPIAVDGTATVATAYLINALPVTAFLDAQGRVVHVALGRQPLATLEHWVGTLRHQQTRA